MLLFISWFFLFKCEPTQRDIVYQCLQGVLKFCHVNVESLMYHMCTLMSNYDIVSSILETCHVSYHFLEFVSIWLRYRKRYCNDEGPWNARSLCKTPFEETLDQIKSYVDMVKNLRTDAAFYNLLYAVSLSEIYEYSILLVFYHLCKNNTLFPVIAI